MKPRIRTAILVRAAVLSMMCTMALASVAFADTVLNVNPGNKTCDIEFSASLTQDAFERFTREMGDLLIYRNGGVGVMPAGDFELGIGYSSTLVEQASDAWNNTFTHPNADHPLGDAIALPKVYGRVGLGRNMDLGAYFTGNADASYRAVGLGLKHGLGERAWVFDRPAVSLDYGLLFGPHDTTVNALGMDLHSSWSWKHLSTYVSGGGAWAYATENSPVVDLDPKATFWPHATIGVIPNLPYVNVEVLARFASVNTLEVKIGHVF